MKLIITILCFTGVCVMVSSLSEDEKPFCLTEDDCSDDECCVVQTLDGFFGNGTCKPLTSMGENCSEDEAILNYFGGKYVKFCPCQDNLECEITNENDTQDSSFIPDFTCQKRNHDFKEIKVAFPSSGIYQNYVPGHEDYWNTDYAFQNSSESNEDSDKSEEMEIFKAETTNSSTENEELNGSGRNEALNISARKKILHGSVRNIALDGSARNEKSYTAVENEAIESTTEVKMNNLLKLRRFKSQ